MSGADLLIDRPCDGVAVLTLNRPEAYNALTTGLYDRLHQAVLDLAAGDEVRAIVITGAGEKAFSAGYDVKELVEFGEEEQLFDYAKRDQYMLRIAQCRAVVIAAVNGLAYGGGANLAMACDIRVGCERAKFRVPAVSYAGHNSTWSLPHIVGHGVAKDWLLTGRVVDAQEAYMRGLLNYMVAPEDVLAKAVEVASGIAGHSPTSPRAIKRLIDESGTRSRGDALRTETAQLLFETPRVAASDTFDSFLNKRK